MQQCPSHLPVVHGWVVERQAPGNQGLTLVEAVNDIVPINDTTWSRTSMCTASFNPMTCTGSRLVRQER